VAAIAGNTDGWAAISSSQRKYGQFGALELNLFRELLPHVGRGVTLRRRLSGLDVQHDAAGDLVDCLPTPVILVDCGAKPLLVNRAARELLSRRDGLSCTRDGLVADSPSETRCLWRLVAEAAASGAGNGFNAGGLIKISRRSLKQPFAVLVAPLRPGRQGRSPFRNSAAVVFIQDLDARPKGVFRILRTMYGLTPAESRVAALLAGGAGTVTVADTLGVAPSTIRTHVKRIFAKTGVRTQAQLVRLLSGLAALDLE
jgi:DNA-binding CsgD family transcriptional regulator